MLLQAKKISSVTALCGLILVIFFLSGCAIFSVEPQSIADQDKEAIEEMRKEIQDASGDSIGTTLRAGIALNKSLSSHSEFFTILCRDFDLNITGLSYSGEESGSGLVSLGGKTKDTCSDQISTAMVTRLGALADHSYIFGLYVEGASDQLLTAWSSLEEIRAIRLQKTNIKWLIPRPDRPLLHGYQVEK